MVPYLVVGLHLIVFLKLYHPLRLFNSATLKWSLLMVSYPSIDMQVSLSIIILEDETEKAKNKVNKTEESS